MVNLRLNLQVLAIDREGSRSVAEFLDAEENGMDADRRIKGDRTMPSSLLECSFFIPLRRDANLSDGALHPTEAWEWLDNELFVRYGGGTMAPGEYHGFYQDPDTGQRVNDASNRFIVAISKQDLAGLRSLLTAACVIFAQKCIYLSVAGKVEFVEANHGN